jgi:hypothetical protein
MLSANYGPLFNSNFRAKNKWGNQDAKNGGISDWDEDILTLLDWRNRNLVLT